MQRNVSPLWLALALGTLSTSCSNDVAKSTTPAISAGLQHDDTNRPVTYAVIGDVPYLPFATATDRFPTLISAINADPAVERVIHVGDIKSGSSVCSDEYFQTIASAFTTFSDPLVYAIGDNEWTDCHRLNNGGYNPLDRLAKVRQLFFANPGYTLGGQQLRIKAQQGYPENQEWMAANAVFSVFHIIGSNNGRAPWFGDRVVPPGPGETAAETASREAEWAARDNANLKWLDRTFEIANEEQAKGVVLFFQADMWNQPDRDAGVPFDAFTGFVTRVAALAAQFGRPVLMVVGDFHNYRVDAGVPWFSTFYGVTPPANLTQVVVDRSIEATTDATPIDYLRLKIDPASPAVFSWEQVFVP
jgi:hypothetical protein